MHKYRKEFSAILTSTTSNLTKSRFVRLFLMSLTLVVIFLPCQFYILYRNATFPHLPYSWAAIHGPMWSDITLIPTHGVVTFDHWIQLAIGYAVFLFFGMGADATKMYRKWLLKLGFGHIFPGLNRQLPLRAPDTTGSHPSSFGSRARFFFNRKLSISSKTSTYTETTATLSPRKQPLSPLSTILSESDRSFSTTPSKDRCLEKQPYAAEAPVRASWLSRVFTFRFSTPPPSYDVEAQAQTKMAQEPVEQGQRDYGKYYRNMWSTKQNAATMGLQGSCFGGVSGMKV